MSFNAEKIKSGMKNFLMDVGSKVKITTTPPTQFYHMTSPGYIMYKDDWQSKLRDKEADVNAVYCACSNTLFVCEDERVFAVGQPNTWRKRWSGSYDQTKEFFEVPKPRHCKDYVRVDASASCRLILTSQGNLFC